LGRSNSALSRSSVLLIFGAGKLPKIGKAMGEGIGNFRRASSGIEDPADSTESIEVKEVQQA
jgi:sec-independent protein translocase protein TatA